MAIIFLSDGAAGIGGTLTAASIWNGPTSGVVTFQNAIKSHGAGALQHFSGASASAYVARLACLADAGRRINLNVSFNGYGGSGGSGIIRALNGSVTNFEIRLTNAGKLALYGGSSGTTLLDTSTITLSLNTFYRIALCYVITNTTISEFRVYVDGVLECTASNPTSQGTLASTLRLGWTGTSPGVNISMFTSDIYVDNDTSLADPGEIFVTNKRPAGLGATNDFAVVVGTGTNRWDRVAELPVNTANRYSQTATGQVSESYTVEAAAVGDDDLTGATLLGWAPWVHYAVVTSSGSTLASMIANNGIVAMTTTQASGIYQTIETIIASTSYPSGNNVVGLRSTGTTVDTHLAECGIFIAYTAAAALDPGPAYPRSRSSRYTQLRS